MDCGCYTVNAIRYFSGLEVEQVEEARPRIIEEDADVDGRMDAVLKLRGGAEARLITSLTNSWWSLQTYLEYFPRVVVETEDKIFTFLLFVFPSVSGR